MYKLLLFIYFPFFCFSQNKTVVNILQSNLSHAEKISKVDTLLIQKYKNPKKYSNDLTQYADWLNHEKKYRRAIIITKKNLEYSNNYTVEDLCFIQELKYKLGVLYGRIEAYNKALKILHESLNLKAECNFNYKINNAIATCYRKTGDYYKAIDYLKYAATSIEKEFAKKPLQKNKCIILNAINTSRSYNGLEGVENIEKGRAYLLNAKKTTKNSPLNYYKDITLNMSLFSTYNFDETLNIEQGNFYLNKALDYAQKKSDSTLLNHILRKKGNLYNTTNQDTAIYYHKKAAKYIPKNDHKSIQYIYGNLAYCYLLKKKYTKSVHYSKKVIKELSGFDLKELIDLKNRPTVYNIKDKNRFCTYLDDYCKSIIENPLTSNNPKKLREAIQIYYIIDELIDLIQINSTEQASKLHWRQKATTFYNNAINVCSASANLTAMFCFMEKSKALVLSENLDLKRLKDQHNLPKGLITSINTLRSDIYTLNKKPKAKKNNLFQKEFLEKKKELAYLNDSIRKLNPKTSEFKINQIQHSLSDLQNSLANHEYVIEYYITDAIGYGLFIGNNETIPFQLNELGNLQTDLKTLLKKISKPFTTVEEKEGYLKLANNVFLTLFPNQKIRSKIKGSKVTIIPDGLLNYLPFEALVPKANSKKYLLEETEVHYEFSNYFSEKNKRSIIKKNHSLVAFAPENFMDNNISTLPNSIKEIESIRKYLPFNLLIKEKATKKQFLKELPKNDIIHLATHANANDSILPWIAFHDQKIMLDELYLTNNNAELVVLSACKTNTGKLEIGEGIMSITRGFFQTGSKSIISSLWNVDDKSTATIMGSFYKNLANSNSKSTALRKAKLNYLNNHSLSETSPYYWASLVLIGNNEAISTSNNNSLYYLIIAFILIVFGFFKKLKKTMC